MEGQAHCYVFCSPGCKKWDTCAPEAILHAIGKVSAYAIWWIEIGNTFLGGKLTDIKGDFYEYHKETTIVDEWGVLATAKADDHDQYLNMIPQECKDQVKDYFKNKSKK